MVEEGYPGRDQLIGQIKSAGFRCVRLVPFMLVAGVHFQEDLAGPEDSWKSAFEAEGLEVALETEGLGAQDPVIDLFGDHIHSALSIIPQSAAATPASSRCAGELQ
jgi:sirohydrochlorin cobaltochelatase